MRYAQLRKMDISNGEGIRVSLFTSGCTHNCKGCFNKEYQSFSYGQEMNYDVVDEIIEELRRKEISGLTLLGGEPLQSEDLYKYLKPIREELDIINKNKEIHDIYKNIWIYSGYTLDEILMDEEKTKIFELCDVLVDGKFVEEKLDLTLRFRGSSNQRIIDLKKTLKEREIAIYME